MVALVLCVLLNADNPRPDAVARELKVAAPGLVLNGIDAALSAPLTDQLARPFSPIRVITPRDIAALLGLERQKELIGCTDVGQCMAELGNALGVQGVLLGDIVKLGGEIQLNTRIIDPVGGKPLATASARIASEEELFDTLTRLGLDLRAQFYTSMGIVAPPAPQLEAPKTRRGIRRFFPIPLAVGGASVIAGTVLFVLSNNAYGQLTTGGPQSISTGDAMVVAQNGKTFQTAGVVLLSVGVAALLAGVALLIFGSPGS